MYASIFVVDSGLRFHMTESADSAEECLRKLQDRLNQRIDSYPRLSFRPHDGMIFWDGSHIPIGVLYREGYTIKNSPRCEHEKACSPDRSTCKLDK